MKYVKQIIGSLQNCYSMTELPVCGETRLLVASEKRFPCFMFSESGTLLDTVWEEPGGVMTMVPVPGKDGVFLATQCFYSPNDSAEAKLVCVTKTEKGPWETTIIAELPFVHRFDIIERNGVSHIIACTLKSGHEYKNDWRFPGKVFVGVLGNDPKQPLALSPIAEGLGHNHGYTRFEKDGTVSGVISSDEGVFLLTPPAQPDAQWTIRKLYSEPCSDAILIDLNHDGKLELVTISPFHGDKLSICEDRNGVFVPVYMYPEPLPFLHSIFGGSVYGRATVYIGNREGERLFLGLFYDDDAGKYATEEVDRGCGSTNCMLFRRNDRPALLSANREINEIAIYDIYE